MKNIASYRKKGSSLDNIHGKCVKQYQGTFLRLKDDKMVRHRTENSRTLVSDSQVRPKGKVHNRMQSLHVLL